MNRCIYCFYEQKGKFGREHVIPKAFGSFGKKTPTLFCVCDKCNEFFGNNHDLILARNSLEGLERQRFGIRMRPSASNQEIAIKLVETPDMGEMKQFVGLYVGLDGSANVTPPLNQVVFIKNDSVEKFSYLEHELDNLNWKRKGYLAKNVTIYAKDEDAWKRIIGKLQQKGIDFSKAKKQDIKIQNAPTRVFAELSGMIKQIHLRAMAKVLFNFSAYYFGAEEVLKPVWNSVRDFVRHGTTHITPEVSDRPFWENETKERRLHPNCYNVRVTNFENNVLGRIMFFNLMRYDFVMVRGYQVPDTDGKGIRFEPGKEPIEAIKRKKILIARKNIRDARWDLE